MVVNTKKSTEHSLDDIVAEFSLRLAEFKEAKWEQALATMPAEALDGEMHDLDFITDYILTSDATQEALKFMTNTIDQLAWTRMRKDLLDGIHVWYKTKLDNVRRGKLLLAAQQAKQNGTIDDADWDVVNEVEDAMVSQFEATVEHLVTRPPIDTVTETTAEQAIAQAMAEESADAVGEGCSLEPSV